MEIHSLLEVMTENGICKAVWNEKRKSEPGFYGDFLLVNEQQRISLLVSLWQMCGAPKCYENVIDLLLFWNQS